MTKGPQTNAPAADFAAADLGAAVEAADGQLSFLFGDTRPASRATPLPGEDALGRTTQSTVARNVPPTLTYALTYPARDGMFAPFSVPGIDLGINNTPQDGVSLPSGQEVVFLGTGSNGGPYSTMAVTAETAVPSSPSLSLDHVVNTQYFEYVSSYYEPSDGYVYIFGTGPYFRHNSGVQLARAPAGCVHDRSSWTYYTGNSKATFETGENNAQAAVRHRIRIWASFR